MPSPRSSARPANGSRSPPARGVTGSARGRLVWRLEYESYQRMALDALAALERQACERFALAHCAVVHRLGAVPVGEASVAVVVSSPHRLAAFDASRWLMDEIKRSVRRAHHH